jgi:type II secretory pathway predicted ATPase ExeA
MNLITPAIDAFLATGTCAVLVSLLVIRIKARKRAMKVGPNRSVYYAQLARQAGPVVQKPVAANLLQHQPSPAQTLGLAARNGSNRVPPVKEKIMEREIFGNENATPMNSQPANCSSETPLEFNSFAQDAPQFIAAEEGLPTAMPPAADVEEVIAEPIEVRIVDMDAQEPMETPAALESCHQESEIEHGFDSSAHYQEQDQEQEEERAEAEAITSAISARESERQIAIGANDMAQDSFAPVAVSTVPEIAAVLEAETCSEVTEDMQQDVTASEDQEEDQEMAEDLGAVEPIAPVMLPQEAEARAAAPNLLSFHGLKQQPFDVTPDPSFLYSSPSHSEALASISEGIENFRGFMTLVAEPGMGKTTLLNKLMEDLSDTARVVFLFQTQCNSGELLAFILNELEVDHAGMDVVAMHRALNQVLLEEMLRGRRFVLIVDEGQNLQDSVLETIRLLSDFETAHSKLIQIVLAGQPQLVDTLLRPGLVQLRQRIAVLSSLKPLTAAETAAYVDHRLRAAGWNGQNLFTPDALNAVAELSGGVPRTINNLCFNALLKAFTRRQEIIDEGIVKEVAGKLHLEDFARRPEKVAEPVAAPQSTAEQIDRTGMAQLARALTAALSATTRPHAAEPAAEAKPKSNAGVVVNGKLIEKISAQSWSKKHELRLDVSFERDPLTGIPVADRHYCCNFYVGEEEASKLQAGKPIRIRIEQD